MKYSYISNKVIKVGGSVVSPDGLTRLDTRTLQLAIKNKVIKEIKDKDKEDGSNEKRKGGTTKNSDPES